MMAPRHPSHPNIEYAHQLLSRVCPMSQYGERAMVSLTAQLGPGMLYRPGLAGDVDGAMT